MKSSMSFSKKTLFSQSVSSASMSRVLRRMRFRLSLFLSQEHRLVYQPQRIFGDVCRGVGPRHALSGFLHPFKANWLIEQRGNLPGGDRQVVAADGRAGFEEVIGVAFFLTRNGIDQHHRQSASERLRSGEAAGFANQEISGSHVLIHLGSEANGAKAGRDSWQCASLARQCFQALAHFFGFAGDSHNLPGTTQLEQAAHDLFDGPDAFSACCKQDYRRSGVKAEVLARRVTVYGFGEEWIDGNASDAQLFAGNSDGSQVLGGFRKRYVIAVDRAAKPQRVDVIVRDYDGIAGAQFLLGDEPGENLAG